MNEIIVLVNSQTGFCRRFLFPQFYKASGKSILAHYFPYDVKLRLLAHSRSSLADKKARNAIVGAENLLNYISINTQVIIQNRALSLARYLGLSADNHLDGQNGCQ